MKISRELNRELAGIDGLDDYAIETTRGNHLKITMRVGGAKRVEYGPSTPSDWRSMHNVRARVKRAARELGAGDPGDPADPDDLRRERRRGTFVDPAPWPPPPSQPPSQPPAKPPRRAARPRFLPVVQEEDAMPKQPERDQRKQRTMNAMNAVGASTLIKPSGRAGAHRPPEPAAEPATEPDAKPDAKPARGPSPEGHPLERLTRLEMQTAQLHAMVTGLRHQVVALTEVLAGRAAAPAPKPEPRPAPKPKPAPKPARKSRGETGNALRNAVVRDKRWPDWRVRHGWSAATVALADLRRLARTWGLIDESGAFTPLAHRLLAEGKPAGRGRQKAKPEKPKHQADDDAGVRYVKWW